jgi:Domain of unknown function (DUF4189)
MNNCNELGPNCEIRGDYRKTCVAVAVQDGNNGWWTGVNVNMDLARQQALLGCARMGPACTIRGEFCDTGNEPETLAADKANESEAGWAGLFSALGNHISASVLFLQIYCVAAVAVLLSVRPKTS